MRTLIVSLGTMAALGACAHSPAPAAPAARPGSLKDAYAGRFMMGAALNQAQFTEQDGRGVPIVKAQFNTITPENILKWESVHPRLGEYAFVLPDKYVEFGEKNGMFIVGHTLVWHNQTPSWVFQDAAGNPVSRDTLLARLRDHILTVVGRYRGRIKGWDVVNEALDEDGSLRRSKWLTIIGDDYLTKAYEFAREADPQAELYYNDYSLENAPKRNGAVALIKRLQSQGVRIAAVGLQGHNRLDWPTIPQEDSTIAAFAALGIRVNITELDIDVLPRATGASAAEASLRVARDPNLDPYKAGLPDSVQQALAKRYGDLFGVYLKYASVMSRVTFWGVTDGDSWLNNWPMRGRTNHPLLFDRTGQPKPAFDAVVRAAAKPAIVP